MKQQKRKPGYYWVNVGPRRVMPAWWTGMDFQANHSPRENPFNEKDVTVVSEERIIPPKELKLMREKNEHLFWIVLMLLSLSFNIPSMFNSNFSTVYVIVLIATVIALGISLYNYFSTKKKLSTL